MWISLTCAGNRDLSSRCFKVDAADDPAAPVWIVHLEDIWMKFHGSGWDGFRNLWTSFQTGAAASAERFIVDDHTTGV
jgi:hypothetical protein